MRTSTVTPRVKNIAHKDFARRMAQACDGQPHVPPQNFGRLQWFTNQLENRFGIKTSAESVRKWLAGEAFPRPKTLSSLAELLEVDEAWLSLGITANLDSKQRRLRNAEADGAVNVVAGFVQMCGSNPAYPTENDTRAEAEHVDLYAIIRGAQYAFHVTLAVDGTFVIPLAAENTFVVGVVRKSDVSCDFYEIPHEVLIAGRRKGGAVEVDLTDNLKPIRTFAERL